MCLAIPVQIIKVDHEQAVVDMGGVQRVVQVNLLPDLCVGDFVLVHAGFAIQKWDEQDVQEYNAIMDEMKRLG